MNASFAIAARKFAMTEIDQAVDVLVTDRRGPSRRGFTDRRSATGAAVLPEQEERRLMPRRKVERRRQIDPTTCERDYTADEIEFMKAMDDYKRKSGRQFPTWSEVLEVVRSMGYKRD
jgi:hypothetical protein